MTPEQPRLDPNQMHDHMWVDDGLYVLGCLERRVTLYSQQVRALNLIYALNHLQVISPGGTLLIVGGGVAGLTAAAGAARLGCRVILLEREKELLHLQRNNKKRWVHPHIYDWPAPDSTRSDAGLPLLNWDAEFAGEVATRILDEFEALPERKLITVHLNAQLIDLGEGPTRHVFLDWAIL